MTGRDAFKMRGCDGAIRLLSPTGTAPLGPELLMSGKRNFCDGLTPGATRRRCRIRSRVAKPVVQDWEELCAEHCNGARSVAIVTFQAF